jgi:L-ascorbate metabolism protein UlaG (beta-lactamase superfamily)
MTFLKKWLIGLLTILLFIGAAVLWFGWSLSTDISATRLQRLQVSPQFLEGSFANVERQAPIEITWQYLHEQFFGKQQREPTGIVPVIPLEPAALEEKPHSGLRATWLGHASVLIEIDGHRILTDPVFSQRASPFQFIGPKRLHPPPIQLSELNGIDAVVVSHNHYDHLDETAIRHLAAQGTSFFVPLGIGAHLEAWDIPNSQIHEMDWWQEKKLGQLTIIATPTRHYSGRGFFDYKATLWASWSVIGPKHRFFYSGDTGYSKLFRQIGKRLGPFDLSIIKIGSYGPGAAWIDVHMTPEDAIQVHLDVGGKRMLPVHWATFDLGIHAWDEPIERAVKASTHKNVRLLTPRVGETITAGQKFSNIRWWEKVR